MLEIGNRRIKNFTQPYLIAEIGANHNGDMALAKRLIDATKESGWHAAKFQAWSADSIFSKKVYEDNYFLGDDYRNRTDYTLKEIVDEYSVSFEQLSELSDYCKLVGIDFCCTPFSNKEVDFLVDELKVPFIKIASMDCNNYPFLAYCASKGLPMVLSTGLTSLHEVDRALETCEQAGNVNLSILHCVAQYPPKMENVNLNTMDMLRGIYPDYPIGFSDHSIGSHIPLAAIAKGACIIEKHVTLDKSMFGWDHKVSATPDEMTVIAQCGGDIVEALGHGNRRPSPDDMRTRTAFRRSIVSARPIPAGKIIEAEDLDIKRPGTGLAPESLEMIVGRIARKNIEADVMLTQDDF